MKYFDGRIEINVFKLLNTLSTIMQRRKNLVSPTRRA